MGTAFGDHIRQRRLEKRLSLRATARLVGVSPSYLSRLESGDEENPPSEKVIRKLAEVLEDDFDELMRLARRVSKDVYDYVASTPVLADFLRTAKQKGLGEEEFALLKKKLEEQNGGDDTDGD